MSDGPIIYKTTETTNGWALTLGKSGLVDGFETRDSALEWLLAYFDNNPISNTRLGFEKAERDVHLQEQLSLMRAALLEVDPSKKPN